MSSTQEATTAVQTNAYFRSDVEQFMQDTSTQIMDMGTASAKELGDSGLPNVDDDLDTYTSPTTSAWNVAKSKVLSMLNVEGLKARGAALLKRFKKDEDELTKKVTELTSRSKELKKEVDKKNADEILRDIRIYGIVHPILIAVLGIEGISLESVMAMMSSSGFVARVAIATGICICTYFVARIHVVNTRKAKGKASYIPLHIAYFLGTLSVFWLLGTLRMSYLESMDPDMAGRTSVYVFAGISFFFYIGTVTAKLIFMPSKADFKYAMEFTRKRDELQKMNKELESAQKELKALPEKREAALYEAYSLLKMSEKYMEQCDQLHRQAISSFIIQNNLARHDGKTISAKQYRGGDIPLLTQYEFTTEEI
ncbi:MAG: hypothetical protein Crog4KO_19140 [Crocinitomicaceae bacterium]